jgi:hypothetical protein
MFAIKAELLLKYLGGVVVSQKKMPHPDRLGKFFYDLLNFLMVSAHTVF